MILMHGTTLNRYEQILKDGYLGTDNTLWNCSEDSTTYFYGEEQLKEEDAEGWFNYGISQALGSAEIGLCAEQKNLKRVVLILDSENLKDLGTLEKDTSCENTEAYQFRGKIPVSRISKIYVDKEYLDLYRMYFLGMSKFLEENQYYEVPEEIYNLPSEILEASKLVYRSEDLSMFWLENMQNLDVLEEVNIQ